MFDGKETTVLFSVRDRQYNGDANRGLSDRIYTERNTYIYEYRQPFRPTSIAICFIDNCSGSVSISRGSKMHQYVGLTCMSRGSKRYALHKSLRLAVKSREEFDISKCVVWLKQ